MKEATGHGGLRAGAGRKRSLDYLSELHVGARAHNYQRKIAERRAMSKHRATMARLGITDAQKKAVEILRTEGPEHWYSSYEGEDTRDDIIGGFLCTLCARVRASSSVSASFTRLANAPAAWANR